MDIFVPYTIIFIISGMVFSIKEVKYTKFLKNKVITLLVPYIVFRIIEIMFGMIYSTMLGSSITYIDIRNRVVGLFYRVEVQCMKVDYGF